MHGSLFNGCPYVFHLHNPMLPEIPLCHWKTYKVLAFRIAMEANVKFTGELQRVRWNAWLYSIFIHYLTFSALSAHKDILPNRFRKRVLCDTESSVPFSIDHMLAHPIFSPAPIPDTICYLSRLLLDRHPHNSCSYRKNFFLPVVRTEVQYR